MKKSKQQLSDGADERSVVLAMLKSLYGNVDVELGTITPNFVRAWVDGKPVILRRNRDAQEQILGRTEPVEEGKHGKENEDVA